MSPKMNPKHNKKMTQEAPMGLKRAVDDCIVKGCSEKADHHLAISNLDGYMNQLNWELKIKNEGKKTARGALCKKHYKDYKKLLDKDEKYISFKKFDPQKPNRDKPHYNLE